MSQIPLTPNAVFYQSGYLYAQAAGSTARGADGSSPGLHLRWDFMHSLRDRHIAKGDLATTAPYTTQVAFNKPRDFVRIFRAQYGAVRRYPAVVSFKRVPDELVESGATREWYYNNVPARNANTTTNIVVRFADVAQYDALRAAPNNLDPSTAPIAFIQAYTGMLEVGAVGKLCFAANLITEVQNKQSVDTAYVKIESISTLDTNQPDEHYITCRKKFSGSVLSTKGPGAAGGRPNPRGEVGAHQRPIISPNVRVVCENIEYVRFVYSNAYPIDVALECYEDYIVGENNKGRHGDWDVVGDFALSLDDTQVYKQLDHAPANDVNRHWPKFVNTKPSTGQFTVNTANYKDRWLPADAAEVNNGLKQAVISYLTLSTDANNLNAVADLPSQQGSAPQQDLSQLNISYLDMLRVVALDFHVARMLGLGTIDTPPAKVNTQQFVYVAEYITQTKLLGDYPHPLPDTANVSHLYMTMPTSKNDYRLPPAPVQDPVTYGLQVDNATDNPIMLTDANGYTAYDDSRFVDLNKEPFSLLVPLGPFFETNDEFCLCDVTIPVMYGIEYKKDGEASYRKPEISNDPDYSDASGLAECLPVLEQPNPFFVHQETEEGIHDYAIYAINWFSRPSLVSNEEQTDNTAFPKRQTLLPPLNLAVQLIQEESPLVLTTQKEQDMLSALENNSAITDKTFVRTTFDWNHTHNIAYQYATYAELFFREHLPLSTRGQVATVSDPDSNHTVTITTSAFSLASSNPAQNVQPNIPSGMESRFVGGIFNAGEIAYQIESVTVSGNGDNPTFVVRQIRETSSADPDGTNHFVTTESYTNPSVGDQFMVVENMNNPLNWTSKLKRRIGLVKFSTVDTISITNANENNGDYTVDTIALVSNNTEITVKEAIPGTTAGNLVFKKTVAIVAVDIASKTFTVAGNVVTELQAVSDLNVLLSDVNDGTYTISSVTANGNNTDVKVTSAIPSANQFGNVIYDKTVTVAAVDQTNKKFTVNGLDLTTEIIPSHRETYTQSDGSTVEYNIGGVFDTCTIKEYLDVDQTHPQADPDLQDPTANPPQVGIQGSKTGIFKITFDNFDLSHHPDPDVDWHKGTVRITDSTATPVNTYDPEKVKVLQVIEIKKDTNGNLISPLTVVAYDATYSADSNYTPTNGYVPIQTGGGVQVNFHPSYRTYYYADDNAVNEFEPSINGQHTYNNNFDSQVILPAQGQGTKQTIMAARAVDTSGATSVDSALSAPKALIAREIVPLAIPDPPQGPLFATRPDFYGKSTYTFDVKLNDTSDGRRPFALVFYRCNEQMILDTLYQQSTVDAIMTALAALPNPDVNFTTRWNELVNVTTNGNGLFNEYDGFAFPLPDNPDYEIPVPGTVKPFAASYSSLNDPFSYTDGTITVNKTMAEVVQDAITSAFLPLTEQPLIYQYLKPGISTSKKKPLFRDQNGDLVTPVSPLASNYDPNVFDPFPMAVRFAKDAAGNLLATAAGVTDNSDGQYVRFTDYKLDGAAKNFYFYYGVEMSNASKFGVPSGLVGPVQLVNAYPAETPGIKKTITQLADPVLALSTAVLFELNDYLPSENIKKFQVFRALSNADALSVRTMTLAKTVDVGDDVLDDFSDLAVPPYGNPLFYRIVALREILNEQAQTEYVPSQPSNLVLTNIVDNQNPDAPQITYTANTVTGTPSKLTNVVLSWPSTAYNATYNLYQMNSSGNWVKIYSVQSNDPTIQVALADIVPALPDNGDLALQDADGNNIYTRFRVQVVNSSGLLNLTENELTVGA